MIPTDHQIQQFYKALNTPKQRCCYLFYATSGLRKSEILSLHVTDIDRHLRMIVPINGIRGTKNTFVSFYNEEAQDILEHEHLPNRTDSNTKLFPFMKLKFFHLWKFAYQKTGIKITPQVLRDWFCSKLGRLGVPDRYVDAFCGGVPRSVLARHYTDFSPETLKEIYDNAELKVLSESSGT
jgi:integrase